MWIIDPVTLEKIRKVIPGELSISMFSLAAMSLGENFYFIPYLGGKKNPLKIFRLINTVYFH